ncbi:MAG: hypothetical protein IJV15_08460 [Lachnospiraceae bacterium]|nr:hypothetical protein [Lachnospiraceae bacterium]
MVKAKVIRMKLALEEYELNSYFDFGQFENVNLIYKGLELIGIFDAYEENGEDFSDYYNKCTQNRKYTYRNRGVDIIYDKVNKDTHKNSYGLEFKISKRNIKRTGIIHRNNMAIVYDGTEVIVKCIFDFICQNKDLYDFYLNHIHKDTINKYLSFQGICIDRFVQESNSKLRTNYINKMKDEIRNCKVDDKEGWFCG